MFDVVPGSVPERTILLVDDEENILSSLKRLLRRDGYRILVASGGEAGLEILSTNPVDVIVSDQRMPGMTGVEFLRRVKMLYPDTVRMVLSGYTEFQSITDAINEGAIYKFLTKPWDDEQLRLNIQEAFRLKELSDENRRLAEELSAANQKLRKLLDEQRRELLRDEVVLGIGQEILQLVPLAIIGLDDDGLIVFANQQADAMFSEGKSLMGCFALDVLPTSLMAVLDGVEGLQIWSHQGRTWPVRYQRIGFRAATQGRLLILGPAPSP